MRRSRFNCPLDAAPVRSVAGAIAVLLVCAAASNAAQAQTFLRHPLFHRWPRRQLSRRNVDSRPRRQTLRHNAVRRPRNLPSGRLRRCLSYERHRVELDSEHIIEFPNNAVIGMNPSSPLTFGPDGALYGTTQGGSGCSLSGCGVIYRLAPPATPCHAVVCRWTETPIYNFHGNGDGIRARQLAGHLRRCWKRLRDHLRGRRE